MRIYTKLKADYNIYIIYSVFMYIAEVGVGFWGKWENVFQRFFAWKYLPIRPILMRVSATIGGTVQHLLLSGQIGGFFAWNILNANSTYAGDGLKMHC